MPCHLGKFLLHVADSTMESKMGREMGTDELARISWVFKSILLTDDHRTHMSQTVTRLLHAFFLLSPPHEASQIAGQMHA